MRKYLYIYKAELMSSLQYIGNILINSLGYVMTVFVFLNLWNYIYSDSSQLINNYSKIQMIWYVIFTEFMWGMFSGRKLCTRISEDVKAGNITYQINKPYSYIGFILSSHLGDSILKGIICLIIGLIMGLAFLKEMPDLNVMEILFIIIISIIAIIINTLFVSSIGLLSFMMEDSKPLFWLYSKAILILGVLFPVEFFPGIIQLITKYSPVYAICYGPARLFVNFNWQDLLSVIISQIFYLIIAIILCSLIYKRGVKRLNVNGG